MNASRPAALLFFLAAVFSSGLSACSSEGASDDTRSPAAIAEPSVVLPERRPDATVIIESVKWNELVVIEVPQQERGASGSGSRSGSGAMMGAAGQWGQTAGRTGSSSAWLFGGGGGGMRFGGGGPGGGQSSAELEELLKSGKRLRIRVPVGIPVAVASTGTGGVAGREEWSFSDIRVGYRASFWLLPADAGASRAAEAVMILGKVER